MDRKKYAEQQLAVLNMRVMYQHAEIVSGAYKFRNLQQGIKGEDGGLAFRPMTDDEKLQHSMVTLDQFVRLAQDCIDSIGEE